MWSKGQGGSSDCNWQKMKPGLGKGTVRGCWKWPSGWGTLWTTVPRTECSNSYACSVVTWAIWGERCNKGAPKTSQKEVNWDPRNEQRGSTKKVLMPSWLLPHCSLCMSSRHGGHSLNTKDLMGDKLCVLTIGTRAPLMIIAWLPKRELDWQYILQTASGGKC